jgi:opacity protein-like surface antigen
MKKTILFLLTLLFSTQLFAQVKNQVLLYGNLGGSFAKNEFGEKSTNFRIAPGVAYNITDHWAAGITGMYSFHSDVDTGAIPFKTKSGDWAVGPIVRYTKPLGELFFIYGQLELTYGQQSAVIVNGVTLPKPDAYRLSANFYPSVGLNLNNGFALNFAFGGLNYTYSKTKALPDAGQQVVLNFGSAFQFGVSKFFGGYGKDAMGNKY